MVSSGDVDQDKNEDGEMERRWIMVIGLLYRSLSLVSPTETESYFIIVVITQKLLPLKGF